ncbi:MAG: endolytic transglycosylase MltG, partial [Saprospiraceae bacterium]
MKKFLKVLGVLLVIGIMLAVVFGYPAYQAIYAPNVPSDLENKYVDIPSNSTFDDVVRALADGDFLIDESSFRRVSSWMKFDKRKTMRAGRFEVKPEMTNRELISHLRVGEQATVDLVISYGRLLEDVAGTSAVFIEADSLSILNKIRNISYVQELGFKPETAMTMVIPNKYNFYWNTDASQFWERMAKEHKNFWTTERLAKAKDLNLTKEEVYTLASIVEGETKYNP